MAGIDVLMQQIADLAGNLHDVTAERDRLRAQVDALTRPRITAEALDAAGWRRFGAEYHSPFKRNGELCAYIWCRAVPFGDGAMWSRSDYDERGTAETMDDLVAAFDALPGTRID